jgi:hypothetical protein
VTVAVATGEKPRAAAQPAEAPEPRLLQPGKVTLEDVVLGLWEDLSAEGLADCPVCGGPMVRTGCKSCGAELR